MVRGNLHNLVMVTALVLVGFLVLRAAGRTQARSWPVVGQVFQLVPGV